MIFSPIIVPPPPGCDIAAVCGLPCAANRGDRTQRRGPTADAAALRICCLEVEASGYLGRTLEQGGLARVGGGPGQPRFLSVDGWQRGPVMAWRTRQVVMVQKLPAAALR